MESLVNGLALVAIFTAAAIAARAIYDSRETRGRWYRPRRFNRARRYLRGGIRSAGKSALKADSRLTLEAESR